MEPPSAALIALFGSDDRFIMAGVAAVTLLDRSALRYSAGPTSLGTTSYAFPDTVHLCLSPTIRLPTFSESRACATISIVPSTRHTPIAAIYILAMSINQG